MVHIYYAKIITTKLRNHLILSLVTVIAHTAVGVKLLSV